MEKRPKPFYGKIFNLLPHPLVIVPNPDLNPGHSGDLEHAITYHPSNFVARLDTVEDSVNAFLTDWNFTIECVSREFKDPYVIRKDFPDEKIPLRDFVRDKLLEGYDIFVVSSLLLEHADLSGLDCVLAAPDTGPTAIRDSEGKILAVRRLVIKQFEADGYHSEMAVDDMKDSEDYEKHIREDFVA